MFDKFDGVFSSQKLEKEFKDQQLQGILQFHTVFHAVLLIIYLCTILICGIRGDIVTSLIMVGSGTLSGAQIIYFKKFPSFLSLTTINMQNIIIALYEFYTVFYQGKDVITFDIYDNFVRGAGLYAIHLSLLVNPNLSSNIIVITIVFSINLIVLSIQKRELHYFAFFMIVCVGLYLSRIRIELIMKRKLFIVKKEKSEWENIIKILIECPYIIVRFSQDQLKFDLVDANQTANKELKINDSTSMQKVLREMVCLGNKSICLELFIFNLIQDLNPNKDETHNGEISDYEESFSFRKTKYNAHVFQIESEAKTYMITLKNQNGLLMQQNSKKIIVNQQIACSNFAHQQLKYCGKLRVNTKHGNRIKCMVAISRNIYDISNFLWIFKTNHRLKISSFMLQDKIVRISKLFPMVEFQSLNGKLECISDLFIFKSMIFNIFTMFQGGSRIFVDILSSNKDYSLKFIIRPINEQTYRLLAYTNSCASAMNLYQLNRTKKNVEQTFWIFKKFLQILSPNQHIQLIYNYELCTLLYLILATLTLKFDIYQDLGILEQ